MHLLNEHNLIVTMVNKQLMTNRCFSSLQSWSILEETQNLSALLRGILVFLISSPIYSKNTQSHGIMCVPVFIAVELQVTASKKYLVSSRYVFEAIYFNISSLLDLTK